MGVPPSHPFFKDFFNYKPSTAIPSVASLIPTFWNGEISYRARRTVGPQEPPLGGVS